MKINWIAIKGHGEILDNEIKFKGVTRRSKNGIELPTKFQKPFAIYKSNVYFESGDITAEIQIEKDNTKIQFILSGVADQKYYVGINPQNNSYGIVLKSDFKFTPLSLAGDNEKPPAGKWFDIRIQVRGSQLNLFISDVLVASSRATISRAQLELVIDGLGTANIKNIKITPIQPIVFVVMQFTEEFDALYKEVIAPVCTSYGYEVVRADDIYTNGLIIEDIARSIRDSSLIVADITPNNANVFYEIGYAHGINKPTILLSDRKREKLPFDISGFRLLFYDNTIGGKTNVETALRKHLDAIRT